MKIYFEIILCILVFTLFACNNNKIELPKPANTDLKIGDLLFQDIDCGEPCDAIEAVTFGFNNTNLSHVAMVASTKNGKIMVAEAVGDYVQKNTLDTFLKRSNKVLVGRLKPEYHTFIQPAIDYINEILLGKPYDNHYLLSNDSYYCSEIIYKSFNEVNQSKDFFELQPMTFKSPKTNKYFPYWQTHYNELGAPIPEGKMGLNPGGMSTAACLDIIYAYEMPSRK